MDDFKKFVSQKPYLKDKINRKETTWQELYEHYDLYGEDDELFKDNEEKENMDDNDSSNQEKGLNGLFDMLSGIDIDKIADGLSGMRKVLGILSELTQNQDNVNDFSKRSKPYSRDDD